MFDGVKVTIDGGLSVVATLEFFQHDLAEMGHRETSFLCTQTRSPTSRTAGSMTRDSVRRTSDLVQKSASRRSPLIWLISLKRISRCDTSISQESCRGDSGHRQPSGQCPTREKSYALHWLRSCSRLPTHLAHPLKDAHAVVIHALGPSLQRSRQNRGEPRRLFPADIPGRGSVVVATRRLCTINTRPPFDHVEVDL